LHVLQLAPALPLSSIAAEKTGWFDKLVPAHPGCPGTLAFIWKKRSERDANTVRWL